MDGTSMFKRGVFLLSVAELFQVVLSQATYDVRLIGGTTAREGRVEIYYDSSWGTVCDDDWGIEESIVVCHQLGYSDGIAQFHESATFGAGSGTIWLDNVSCQGNEASLSLCTHRGWGVEDCSHSEDVGVSCRPTQGQGTEGSLRLQGGATEYEGRLEIFYNGEWGTVCDDNWDTTAGIVACQQLGFSGLDATIEVVGGAGKIWLDDVACTGSEPRISLCIHAGWGIHNCVHNEDVGIRCLSSDGSLRLYGGTSDNEGRLEVMYNGAWGTVCNRNWDITDGLVACQQLGYAGVEKIGLEFGDGIGSIWFDNVHCTGTEDRLEECRNDGLGVTSCDHSRDVGIRCSVRNEEGALRLSGGTTENEGRVEIYHNGVWGTVCDDLWDISNGAVVCRQLGYPGIQQSYDGAHFGVGSGTIWLDDVQCSGIEDKLTDCSHNGWENHNCQHSEDAGVSCSLATYGAEVRLVDGPTEQEGRLEVYHNGQWGSVCDDDWDVVDSRVVCRQLGFSGKADYFTADSRGYTQGTGQIWLDTVTCIGGEERLEFCSHDGWGNNDCTHTEDVGVSCSVTGGGLSGGAIAGIVIGSLVGLCCFYCCCIRKEKKKPPNVVLVSNTRIEGPLESGDITRAADGDNAEPNETSSPVNPTDPDASLPELPPPSYGDIGKYSSYGGPEIAYPPQGTPLYPSAPPPMPYPPSSTDAAVTYPPGDLGVVPSAPPAYPAS